jgi:dephospho-CoA kinase
MQIELGDAMITFGLTGGIASGKSTVNKTFWSVGIPLVDADIVARQVVEPGTEGLKLVISTFGDEYLQQDGTLDRIKLGSFIFGNRPMRMLLDSIMFPLIVDETNKQLKAWEYTKRFNLVGYDAALICEMGRADEFRPLVVVHCPRDIQVARLMSRNNLTIAEAMARIESQMPVEKKLAMADYTIETSGSLDDSKLQTKKIALQMRKSLGLGRYCFNCGREYSPLDKAVMCEGCLYDNPFEAE